MRGIVGDARDAGAIVESFTHERFATRGSGWTFDVAVDAEGASVVPVEHARTTERVMERFHPLQEFSEWHDVVDLDLVVRAAQNAGAALGL